MNLYPAFRQIGGGQRGFSCICLLSISLSSKCQSGMFGGSRFCSPSGISHSDSGLDHVSCFVWWKKSKCGISTGRDLQRACILGLVLSCCPLEPCEHCVKKPGPASQRVTHTEQRQDIPVEGLLLPDQPACQPLDMGVRPLPADQTRTWGSSRYELSLPGAEGSPSWPCSESNDY